VKLPHRSNRLLRGNPFLKEKVHDPYRAREKLRDATSCPACGLRYQHGHWAWPESGRRSLRKGRLCPACQRIKDHYPAGEVIVSGDFLDAHRDEVVSRIRRIEQSESDLHPLHRIMAIEHRGADLVVTTTDVHLPHRIGHALHDAWGGEVRTHYDLEGYFARVEWRRSA
jgi:hypothetical protein